MEYDINQLYFPLNALRFSDDVNDRYETIIRYSIVEYAYRLMNNFELQDSDYSAIEATVNSKRHGIDDYDPENDLHNYVVFAGNRLNITFGSIESQIYGHGRLTQFIRAYEAKHGKDATVKVNRDLLFEVRDKILDEKLFRVFCAIRSIEGSKQYPVRITNNRIRYRMLGFRKQELYYKSKCNDKLLTDRQIRLLVDKLDSKGLICTHTHKKRLKYYSSKFSKANFENYITTMLTNKDLQKEKKRLTQNRIEANIQIKLQEEREKFLNDKTNYNPEMEIISNKELTLQEARAKFPELRKFASN